MPSAVAEELESWVRKATIAEEAALPVVSSVLVLEALVAAVPSDAVVPLTELWSLLRSCTAMLLLEPEIESDTARSLLPLHCGIITH